MIKYYNKTHFACLQVFSLLLAVCSASPQYGGSPFRCSHAYTTVKEVVYEEVEENVCKPVYKTYQEEECKNVHKVVREGYTETVCDMGNEKHCIKTWQIDGYGNKVWVDNPNECKNIPTNKCHDEEKVYLCKNSLVLSYGR